MNFRNLVKTKISERTERHILKLKKSKSSKDANDDFRGSCKSEKET